VPDTLKVVVVDDEKIARARLVRLVEETGAAEVVAAWLVKHNLPAQFLNPDAFVTDKDSEGITTHEAINVSYRSVGINNGDHGDPGPNFPYDVFLDMVRDIMDGPSEYLLNV